MADPAVGLILAAIDTDVDNREAWNRWYDLEHLARNIALSGVITGRRVGRLVAARIERHEHLAVVARLIGRFAVVVDGVRVRLGGLARGREPRE